MKTFLILLLFFVVSCTATETSQNLLSAAPYPICLDKIIQKLHMENKKNTSLTIYSCQYHHKTVYYLPANNKDEFSDLYDTNCTLLGHPDGGVSNVGDGLFFDFKTSAEHLKLIYKSTN